ncbi:HmuY family protein [Myxococcota bacterium]|nr:HmuY family protein [Myxococcota bacterium]
MTPILLLSLLACGDKDGGDDSGGTTGDGGGTSALECTDVTPVSCLDDMIADLGLQDDEVSDGEVTTTTEGEDFVTDMDASAGGYNEASQNPWVYLRFTADGAQKVEIDDEASLEDLTWDIAMRRYLIRVNGGDGGPGCVGAVALREEQYADIDAVPEGLDVATDFPSDDFYTDSCEFINDSSGLEGSPNVVLGQWWSYPGCVATSFIPFLLRTNEGHVVKLVIEQYYGEGQEECNESGAPGDDSGMIKIRWKMLQ